MVLSNPFLEELAAVYGIATQFWDWKSRFSEVSDETVIAILKAMDVDACDPAKAATALEQFYNKPWTRTIPPCVVMEQGHSWRVFAHVRHGSPITLSVRLEDGGVLNVPQAEHNVAPRVINQVMTGEAAFDLPGDLPLGYHRLRAETSEGTLESTLVVSPSFLGFGQRVGSKKSWGYSVQLYSTRSQDSWGMGDLLDLADLATWSGSQQFADFILVNPLHAAQSAPPIEPSPYLPSSRRFINPLYIHPEAIVEYGLLSQKERDEIAHLKAELLGAIKDSPNILRNEIWPAKLAALRIIYSQKMRPARQIAFNDFLRREGRALMQFATWSVLCIEYGSNWRQWPVELQRPSSPQVTDFTQKHLEDIIFHSWLQWIADLQLRNAQSVARDAGMRIGIMNDLAVGVGAESAEAWTYGNLFAAGVQVGAPPDHFNQKGQNWSQSPWRPDRLEELSYAPFRSMVAGLLRHSGGVRIDHIMGLFRLWWIPAGESASKGTYVRYNHEAMVGILLLEAYRAGALVVGEDLGVVEPWVREYLCRRGILGTSVVWFERDIAGKPIPPEQWREYCMASVTTHDMPPTAGYLANDHIYLQHRLGLLSEDLDTELALADTEQSLFVGTLRQRGFLKEGELSAEDIVLALHRYLMATPARISCAALTDAVGDRKTQNQPGTADEYLNWRIPLSKPDGTAMMIEDLYHDERALRLASVMNGFDIPDVISDSDVFLAPED